MAAVVGLFLFYLLVTGQLPQFFTFVTQYDVAGKNKQTSASSNLPSLPSLPSLGSTGIGSGGGQGVVPTG